MHLIIKMLQDYTYKKGFFNICTLFYVNWIIVWLVRTMSVSLDSYPIWPGSYLVLFFKSAWPLTAAGGRPSSLRVLFSCFDTTVLLATLFWQQRERTKHFIFVHIPWAFIWRVHTHRDTCSGQKSKTMCKKRRGVFQQFTQLGPRASRCSWDGNHLCLWGNSWTPVQGHSWLKQMSAGCERGSASPAVGSGIHQGITFNGWVCFLVTFVNKKKKGYVHKTVSSLL